MPHGRRLHVLQVIDRKSQKVKWKWERERGGNEEKVARGLRWTGGVCGLWRSRTFFFQRNDIKMNILFLKKWSPRGEPVGHSQGKNERGRRCGFSAGQPPAAPVTMDHHSCLSNRYKTFTSVIYSHLFSIWPSLLARPSYLHISVDVYLHCFHAVLRLVRKLKPTTVVASHNVFRRNSTRRF